MQRTRPASVLIFAITATAITVNPLIAPAIPDILTDLDAPASAAGWIVGAATMPGIVLAPVIGALADRYGRRMILVPCLVVVGVAGGLAAFAGSIESLVALRLLQGVGSAGLVNLAVVLIGDHWDGPERPAMVGRNAAVLTVSLTVFPLLGGILTDVGGWRLVFAPMPLALLTAALLWWKLPLDRPERPVSFRHQLGRALPTLRAPEVVKVLAGGFLVFTLIFGLLLTVLPVYLDQGFGLAGTGRGAVLGLPAVANTAVALSLGRLRARWEVRRLLVAGTALFVGGLLLVAAATTVLGVLGGVVVFGLGEGLVVPTLQERAASAGITEVRATVVAVFVSVARLGQTLGPVAAAGLAAGPGGPPLAFVAGAGLAAVMGLMFLTLRRGPEAPAT